MRREVRCDLRRTVEPFGMGRVVFLVSLDEACVDNLKVCECSCWTLGRAALVLHVNPETNGESTQLKQGSLGSALCMVS